jgi:hypothetical protein
MTVQVCPNCGKDNPPQDTYCFSCGHILPAGIQALSTHSLSDVETLQPQVRWGTAYFGNQSILRIRIHHTGEWIEAKFETECVLGRTAGGETPDVDLTPYGAIDSGVSRRHVKLTRQHATVMVQDLGSANGTFLNGEKLIPNQPRVLRNEDELCLGRLALRISFLRIPRIT